MDTEPSDQGRSIPPPPATAAAAPARILIVYATRHGSTADVAEWIAEELRAAGAETEVVSAAAALSPAGYDAVLVGGPMIMGWHKDSRRFLKKHAAALAAKPTALFITCASLTESGEQEIDGVPITKDPWLVKDPRVPGKLSYKERYALPAHYLKDALDAAPGLKPLAVAFFAGCLDLATMNLFEKLFVMLAIRATPGDARHEEAVRAWAREVAPGLLT